MKKQKNLHLSQEKAIRRYSQESTLTKKVKEWLNSQDDIFYWKASDRFVKGVSDIIACVDGIFVAIELKKDGGKATPHQKIFIKKVIMKGGIGGVCWCLQDVKDLVDKARKMKK